MTSGFDKFNKPVGFGQGLTPYLDQPHQPSAPPAPAQGPAPPGPPMFAPAPPMGPVADYPGEDIRARRYRPVTATFGTDTTPRTPLMSAIENDNIFSTETMPSNEDIVTRLLSRLHQGNG